MSQNYPQIIEESFRQTRKQNSQQQEKQKQKQCKSKEQENQNVQKLNSVKRNIHEDQFFKVMDLLDEYDSLIKEINDLYGKAMLVIANVKFIDPYSSLSTKGYKPTPAITTIRSQNKQTKQLFLENNEINQLILFTDTTKVQFKKSVIEQINDKLKKGDNQLEQNREDDESVHSSVSTNHHLYSYQEEELMVEEQQCIEKCHKILRECNFSKQEFMLERFNISSQQKMVLQATEKFTILIQKLISLANRKTEICAQLKYLQMKQS